MAKKVPNRELSEVSQSPILSADVLIVSRQTTVNSACRQNLQYSERLVLVSCDLHTLGRTFDDISSGKEWPLGERRAPILSSSHL